MPATIQPHCVLLSGSSVVEAAPAAAPAATAAPAPFDVVVVAVAVVVVVGAVTVFVSVAARDGEARVTIDVDVSLSVPGAGGRRLRPDLAIVETKSEDGDSPADRILVELGAEPLALSKYKTGIALLTGRAQVAELGPAIARRRRRLKNARRARSAPDRYPSTMSVRSFQNATRPLIGSTPGSGSG